MYVVVKIIYIIKVRYGGSSPKSMKWWYILIDCQSVVLYANKLFRLQNDLLEDVNHNETKPSISFLDIHQGNSPDRSPGQQRKPYIPPLDLSILHEHGDGSGKENRFISRAYLHKRQQ